MTENQLKIVFRTHGGENIGLGHLTRCISLALACSGHNIIFVVNKKAANYIKSFIKNVRIILRETFDSDDYLIIKDLKPDIIVVDTYCVDFEYVRDLRQFGKVVIFDDNGEHNPITAHVVINGNLHAKEITYTKEYPDTKLLLGPKYLIMKPDYWGINEENDFEGEGILITTGGADIHNLMPKFINALASLLFPKRVVIGPFYSDRESKELDVLGSNFEIIYKPVSLKKYIKDSKIIITASGSTVYEALTLKKNLLVFAIANNQLLIERKLKELGVVSLGYYNEINWDSLKRTVQDEYNKARKEMKSIFSMFDGKGVFRVKKFLMNFYRR